MPKIYTIGFSGKKPDDLISVLDAVGCTERTAHQCHRRLIAEYLAAHFDNVTVTHL